MGARLVSIPLILAAAALAGCSSAIQRGVPSEPVTLRIENDLTPSSFVTVFALDENGNRRRLGYVAPNRTSELTFDSRLDAMEYRFIAQVGVTPPGSTSPAPPRLSAVSASQVHESAPAVRGIVSTPIDLEHGSAAFWNLTSNMLIPVD
ncbi:MAG: hypothetical protein WD766_15130 [Gemmatimonadota bacterium]